MAAEKKPLIAFTRNTPYMVIDLENLENSIGEKLKVEPVMSLCRCGESKEKPYCDNSHNACGIDGDKQPDRDPYRWKDYWGVKITVHYNLGVCSHDGSCVKMLPSVFNINKRPWINADGATPEEIIRTIKKCPSGALKYTIDGIEYKDFYRGEPKIKISSRGPLDVFGSIELKDDQASMPETQDHYVLCGCGCSKNKPFCDGQHLKKKR
jgi:CDGSH-type Zn-finger protein